MILANALNLDLYSTRILQQNTNYFPSASTCLSMSISPFVIYLAYPPSPDTHTRTHTVYHISHLSISMSLSQERDK